MAGAVFVAFDDVNSWLSQWLAPGYRVILFGALSGVLSMLLYRAISLQQRIRSLKQEARVVRRELSKTSEDFGEVLRLTGINLRVSFGIMGLAIGPALISSVPALIVVLWMYANFHYAAPSTGEVVRGASDRNGQRVEFLLPNKGWSDTMAWPDPTSPVSIRVDGRTVFTGQLGSRAYLGLHERFWLDYVDGLHTAFLVPSSSVSSVSFVLPRRTLWPGVEGWTGHWEWTFFSAVLLSSIFLKFALKIE